MAGDKERLKADVLIIGCGISGSAAALAASKAGLDVLVISKSSDMQESNTRYAQGGIVSLGLDDDPDLLRRDIFESGDGINNPEAVDVLVSDSKPMVDEILIEELGIDFSRNGEDELDFAREGGHSRRRILHVQDTTGKTIEEAFLAALARRPNVRILADHTAVDLLTVPHHAKNPQAYYREPACVGAYVLDNRSRRVRMILAGRTVLATGGCGAVFLNTSNPKTAVGSGYAMALRAGARIAHMEYIQFHPTVLYHRDCDGFLISETVRGEGARLKSLDGRTFMDKYGGLKDLAPRDEVSRAIYEEMILTNADHVLLDLASYAKVDVKIRFPHIFETCLRYGIDISREPIPVVPAAHYCCGGVLVDTWGKTSLHGLYAVGEASCTGLHGANRLASTSLLEGLVWGTRAGRFLAGDRTPPTGFSESDVRRWYYPPQPEEVDPALINQDWLTIRSTMWNYAGLVRTTKRLERAKADLEYLEHRIDKFYREAILDPDIIRLRHGLQVALMIVRAAIANPVSSGAHYRLD
ncbi:MAG: L-aspartate oxidase [Acidobacteriota bacterium]|nr:L-aspartate oxidase [Acidobacteriota bacterium]MDD8038720.1 L-aspartate oxidase [Acidobacteriota bacterium]